MNTRAIVWLVCGLGLACVEAAEQEGGPPAGALVQHAATLNGKDARKKYDAIDWRKVEAPLPVLREMSAALKANGSAEARRLRREINTKYWLLKGKTDPELDDSEDRLALPVVDVVAVDVAYVRSPGLRFTSLDVAMLRPEVVDVMGVAAPGVDGRALEVVVLRVGNKTFMDAVGLWQRRYGRRLDFWDERGWRVVPAYGTVLWAMRRRMVEEVDAGGDYEVLWAEYDEAMRKTVGRRAALSKKGR